MNGKHRAPRKYTHIEKIHIMNDAVVFMFGCMTLDFYARMEKKASEGTVQLECPQRFSDQVKAYIADLLEKEKAAEKQAAPVNSAVEEALPWEREDAPGRDYQSTWNQF